MEAVGKRVTPATWVLTVGVALAFADASIVVLALPAIFARFDTTIVSVSWVLTGYAVAVTLAAGLLAASHRRVGAQRSPVVLTTVGVVIFAGASAWCGSAGSLSILLAGRVVQGIGAAALLSGALAVLCGQLGRERGKRWWSGAATAGLAVGPALGGALTEAFDWRVIFLFQVPVALLVLAALTRVAAQPPPALELPEPEPGGTRRALFANAGYVTLFAGLVGALFLGVLLLVEIWGMSPLHAAAVMTALPAGTLLAGWLPANQFLKSAAGVFGLAAGLLAMALLPAVNAAWAVVALFVCGAGAGMVMSVLAVSAVPGGSRLVRAGGAVVAAKHAGLVLGLVIIAPLLSSSLQDGGEQAVLAGTSAVLDAKMPVQERLQLALKARDAFTGTPRGSIPDVTQALGTVDNPEVVSEVDGHLRAVLTRAFRPAFLAAAGLALLTLLAGVGIGWRRGRPSAPWATLSLVLLPALAVALVGAEVGAGARTYGQYAESRPCTASPDTYPGSGLDATVQRVAYSALNGAACEMGMSRERFVLSLAGAQGFKTIKWDDPTVERAVRAGVDRALDDADARDDLPGWMMSLVRTTVNAMPLNKILDLLGLTGGN